VGAGLQSEPYCVSGHSFGLCLRGHACAGNASSRAYEYFETLVEKEPADAIPPSDGFLLASIGVEKGKSFAPDDKTKQLLAEAARAGAAIARANTFASRNPMAQVSSGR
jgi:hypothetical protein